MLGISCAELWGISYNLLDLMKLKTPNIPHNSENLSEKISMQILKLKEYRQSIISEAVTGKIDVSDWKVE